MNATAFSKHVGVTTQAVTKALRAGQLDGAVRWEVHGSRRVAVIVDLARAVELWLSRPGARAPALERAAKVGPAPAQAAPAPPARPAKPAPGPVPEAEQVTPTCDPLGDMALARLKSEQYKAKIAQLDFERASGRLISVERAMRIFGKQIGGAKTAIMALGKHARSRIPHLSTDDVVAIEELCQQALEGLAAGEIEDPAAKGAA